MAPSRNAPVPCEICGAPKWDGTGPQYPYTPRCIGHAESSRNAAEKGHTDGWVGTGPGAYSVHIRGAAGLFDWKRRDAREIRDVLNALDLDDPKCPTETPLERTKAKHERWLAESSTETPCSHTKFSSWTNPFEELDAEAARQEDAKRSTATP